MNTAHHPNKSHKKDHQHSSHQSEKSHGACTVTIQFPHEQQAEMLEKNMSSKAPNPKLYKKFALDRKGNFLSICIYDIHDTEFCFAFLLAISANVKELVVAANEESALSLCFQGADEAGTAICFASHGLWPAEFSFSNEAEKERFNAARIEVDKQIKSMTEETVSLLKKEFEN